MAVRDRVMKRRAERESAEVARVIEMLPDPGDGSERITSAERELLVLDLRGRASRAPGNDAGSTAGIMALLVAVIVLLKDVLKPDAIMTSVLVVLSVVGLAVVAVEMVRSGPELFSDSTAAEYAIRVLERRQAQREQDGTARVPVVAPTPELEVAVDRAAARRRARRRR